MNKAGELTGEECHLLLPRQIVVLMRVEIYCELRALSVSLKMRLW